MCGILYASLSSWQPTYIANLAKALERYVGSLGYYRAHRNMDGVGTGLVALMAGRTKTTLPFSGDLVIKKSRSFCCDLLCMLGKNSWKNMAALALHTRWPSPRALKGELRFVHPFSDCQSRVWVMHNGYFPSKRLAIRLMKGGHHLQTLTGSKVLDSELIPHLIEDKLAAGCNFVEAVRAAGQELLKHSETPGLFVAFRKGEAVVVFSQLAMKKGSIFAVWEHIQRGKKSIIITTYKDLDTYYKEDYAKLNACLDRLMAAEGFKLRFFMKNGDIYVHDPYRNNLSKY